MLRTYGGEHADELISAATIMLSFMQIITLPLGGISGGTQPALSYNYGANRPDRVKKCEGWILGSCILYTVVCSSSRASRRAASCLSSPMTRH